MKKVFGRIRNGIKIKLVLPFKHNFFRKKHNILIYLGLHKGGGFDELIGAHSVCYGFEANPELYKQLKKRYRLYNNIHIIHAAVTDYNGVIEFNISSNNGASSSIGQFKTGWNDSIKMVRSIEVPAIKLSDFLKEKNIDFIDTY
jgi:FkbM family methyltransferase